ncbi:MAG: hypothetical protein ACKVP7_09020 [Hyphomicrobiaceae bacterium]
MSATIMEGRLLAALLADTALAQQGFTSVISATGGVVIERRGHCFGLWRWNHGMFNFVAAGYSESSAEMETVAEALHFTRQRCLAA